MNVEMYYSCGKFIDRNEKVEEVKQVEGQEISEEELEKENEYRKSHWKLERSVPNDKVRKTLLDGIIYNCDARIEMSEEA